MSNSNRVGEIIPEKLAKYAAEVQIRLEQVLKADVENAKRELKSVSPKKTGEYARGWSVKAERSRFTTAYVIYNKYPGMPHLLEFGHAIRNGTGRDFGHGGQVVHIAPIEEDLLRKVREDIDKAIEGISV